MAPIALIPFINRLRFSAESIVFSNLVIMVMDVNFNNPYKTSCLSVGRRRSL